MVIVNRTWVGHTNYELRHRLFFNPDFTGFHSFPDDDDVEAGFLAEVDDTISQTSVVNFYTVNGLVDWVGDVGFLVAKTGAHGDGRAMDMTAIQFVNGYLDCNKPWFEQSNTRIRSYIGLVASCRDHVGNVLSRWYNAPHADHIHLDDYVGFVPIRDSKASDKSLVQAAIKYILPNPDHPIDPWPEVTWDNDTEVGYIALLTAFDMKCLDPKTNASHASTFLGMLMLHGFGNQDAGYFTYQYC